MIHLIYTYFWINAFIMGYCCDQDTFEWDGAKEAVILFFVLLLIAVFGVALYIIFNIGNWFEYIYREGNFLFWYNHFFTKKHDNLTIENLEEINSWNWSNDKRLRQQIKYLNKRNNYTPAE